MDLTCEAIMASYKVRFMASVIGNEAATPLRPSDGFKTFTEEIPRMGHKFPMSAKKLRKMLTILEASSKRYTDQQKFNEVYKMLMGDTKEAYLGCKDTADHIVLQALSNGGVAQFTPTLNNPDGKIFKVDYLMPEQNKKKAPKNWIDDNKNNINPFEELQAIKLEFEQAGITFGEMCVSPALYAWIISAPAVKKAILGTDKSGGVVTDAQLRETLSQYDLPAFTKIVKRNAIQKDGKRVANLINPWNDNNIVFKPAGTIGEVQPAFEDNEIIPEPNVEYIDAGNGMRVAKWQVGESTGQQAGEYTQASWRALPIITDIAGVVNYQVRGIQ
ncbi:MULTISPECIES: major capsid protein [unclassified Dysgonomonas]|uniref:major capsid protein n=1 Tax=unclassified Dysgonomonas TaxID=2630389 RepID=UPI002476B123|nr:MULTISPECIES: major capsid protein [unclassified Dysgonomonas]